MSCGKGITASNYILQCYYVRTCSVFSIASRTILGVNSFGSLNKVSDRNLFCRKESGIISEVEDATPRDPTIITPMAHAKVILRLNIDRSVISSAS